jgi:hypothetical protein
MEHKITIGGETFRLFYNIKTSANLIETQRPGKSITELLDSGRIQDLTLLMVAGMDETHEKDKRGQLNNTALQNLAEKVTDLVDKELESGTLDLRTIFLPVKRAVGASGIAGLYLEFLDNGQVKLAPGKASTVIAAN